MPRRRSAIKCLNLRTSCWYQKLLSFARYELFRALQIKCIHFLQDMRKLEDTFEQTLVREEQEIAGQITGNGSSEDVSTLQKTIRELKTKYEVSAVSTTSQHADTNTR